MATISVAKRKELLKNTFRHNNLMKSPHKFHFLFVLFCLSFVFDARSKSESFKNRQFHLSPKNLERRESFDHTKMVRFFRRIVISFIFRAFSLWEYPIHKSHRKSHFLRSVCFYLSTWKNAR